MLTAVGSDGERLFHQPVWLISIAVRSASIGIGISSSASDTVAIRSLVEAIATSLAFHLAISEKAAGDPACAPGLAISPSAHASLSLIPYENRAGLDRLPLLLGQSALHPRQQTDATGFEQDDGVCWSTHVTVVSLHGVH